jgi:hypothetical protein
MINIFGTSRRVGAPFGGGWRHCAVCLVALNVWIACALTVFSPTADAAPGGFAGSLRNIVGKSYSASREVPGMKGWTLTGGTALAEDSETGIDIVLGLYRKGTTRAIVMSKIYTAEQEASVLDVLQIPNVAKGFDVVPVLCARRGVPDVEIVALVKKTQTLRFGNVIKAWRANRATAQFQSLSKTGVDCLNEQ